VAEPPHGWFGGGLPKRKIKNRVFGPWGWLNQTQEPNGNKKKKKNYGCLALGGG
jgi:hypothetical protein